MIQSKGETYLTTVEAAHRINRSRQYVYQFHKTFGWRAYFFGQTLLFKETEVQEWIDKQIVPAA